MRKLGAVLAMLVGSSVLVGAVAATTAATSGAVQDGNATLKICKQWTASSIATADNDGQGFVFKVSVDPTDPTYVTVDPGTCQTIGVEAGTTYTVTEISEPWYQETAIAELDSLSAASWDPTLLPGNAPVTVKVPAPGDEVAVQFTDALVTGQTEICKADVSGDPGDLSGTFNFTLSNTADEESSSGGLTWSIPVSVTIPPGGHACSAPVTVPAGPMQVVEGGTNLYVTSISANLSSPTGLDLLLSSDTATGTAVAEVGASQSGPYTTIVSYTDATVGLEVCKDWTGSPADTQPQGTSTEYSFTESVVSGVAGPDTAPATFSLEAGQCSVPTQYRAGTIVQITEGITPGTKVAAINAIEALSEVTPPYPDLANRTTQVIVGAPVDPGTPGSNTDEAVVSFVDELAAPSTLKICKDAPAGSGPFTFTVSGPQYVSEFTSAGKATTGWFPGEIANGSFTVSVPANECEFATPPQYKSSSGTSEPSYESYLPFNGTQLVTESGTTGYAASSVALTDTNSNVGVWEISGFTYTNEPVLTNINLGSSGGSSSADVTISEYPDETDVTWTNVDPPAPSAPTAPVTVANPGGSNAGTTTAPTLPEAISVSKAVTTLNANAHSRALLAKYEHEFVKLGKTIAAIEKALRSLKLTKAQRATDLRLLAHLRSERAHYAVRIVRMTL